MSIRPERVRLPALPSDANRVAAIVEHVGFFGAELQYRLRLESGRIIELALSAAAPQAPARGDSVLLGIDPGDCRLTAET